MKQGPAVMSDERLAIVDVEGWRGGEIGLALEAQGWRVSRCRDALRSIFLPKIDCTLVTAEADPANLNRAVDRCRGLAEKGHSVVLLVSMEGVRDLDALGRVLSAWDGQIVPVEDAIDIADYIAAKSTRQAEEGTVVDEREAIRLMTWRLEGLPPECTTMLQEQYKSIHGIVEAALSVGAEREVDEKVLLLQEIATFLKEDYYLK